MIVELPIVVVVPAVVELRHPIAEHGARVLDARMPRRPDLSAFTHSFSVLPVNIVFTGAPVLPLPPYRPLDRQVFVRLEVGDTPVEFPAPVRPQRGVATGAVEIP